jgi:anaerobic selenocysteine-containing dehydrogenase
MWVELCPQDAHELGIGEGDLVRVESRHGGIQAPARLSGTRPGVVFAPFHYGYFDTPGGSQPDGTASAANEATHTEWDPVSKQPIVKLTAVRVRKLADASSQPVPAPAIAAAASTTETDMHTRGGPAANTATTPGASP